MQQWRDPVAARLLNAAGTRRLVRLEDKRIRAIVEIRRDARLVRERPAPELREIANSIDPQLLQTLGGPIGLSLDALGSRLDDLERAVAPSERARFLGYRQAVDRSVNPPAPFWPRADDEFLLELAARRWPPREEI